MLFLLVVLSELVGALALNGMFITHGASCGEKSEFWRQGSQKICVSKFFAALGAKIHFFRHKMHRDNVIFFTFRTLALSVQSDTKYFHLNAILQIQN